MRSTSSPLRTTTACISVLLGALMIQMVLGTIYGYSVFWQPLADELFPSVVTEAEHASLLSQSQLQDPGSAYADASRVVIVRDDDEKRTQLAHQQGLLKYAFSVCVLAFAGVMVIAGQIQDRVGPRIPAAVGGAFLSVGYLIAGLIHHPSAFIIAVAVFLIAAGGLLAALSRQLKRSVTAGHRRVSRFVLALLIVAGIIGVSISVSSLFDGTPITRKLFVLWTSIGFLAGAGIGFAYVCPIAALVKWFPNHKGLVSGFAVAGFGFGAFLMKGRTVGALGYIESHGIQSFFLLHALICFSAVTLGAWLLRNPPSRTDPQSLANQPNSASKGNGDLTWKETLRTRAFFLLWTMFFSGAMAGLMVVGILKVFAGEQLIAAAESAGAVREAGITEAARSELLAKGAAAVGWLAIFNAVGRIAWGFISDRVGRTTAFIAMFIAQAVMMLLLSTMQSELTLAIAASVVGFNFGGNFALFPSATADFFGSKNLGANYGWVYTSYGIAGVVGIAAGNTAKTLTGSYTPAFLLAAALCIFSAGLAVMLAAERRKLG